MDATSNRFRGARHRPWDRPGTIGWNRTGTRWKPLFRFLPSSSCSVDLTCQIGFLGHAPRLGAPACTAARTASLSRLGIDSRWSLGSSEHIRRETTLPFFLRVSVAPNTMVSPGLIALPFVVVFFLTFWSCAAYYLYTHPHILLGTRDRTPEGAPTRRDRESSIGARSRPQTDLVLSGATSTLPTTTRSTDPSMRRCENEGEVPPAHRSPSSDRRRRLQAGSPVRALPSLPLPPPSLPRDRPPHVLEPVRSSDDNAIECL